MASQQDSTTQSVYSLGSEEPSITNKGLMTRHTEHTGNGSITMSEYRQPNEKAEKPDYLPDPSEGTRS